MIKDKSQKVKVLTIKGVCEVFGCTRQTYYNRIKHRLEPYPTVERQVYYKEDDVLRLKAEIDENGSFTKPTKKDYEVVK